MFSSMEMEEYMESELSDIFLVKLVAKSIMLGSMKSNFIHMGVNIVHRGVLTHFSPVSHFYTP